VESIAFTSPMTPVIDGLGVAGDGPGVCPNAANPLIPKPSAITNAFENIDSLRTILGSPACKVFIVYAPLIPLVAKI
jgi:hypothetical protein